MGKKTLEEREERNRNMELDMRHLGEENRKLKRRLKERRVEERCLEAEEEEKESSPLKPCSPDMFSSPVKPGPGPKYKVLGVKRIHSDESESELDNFSPQLKSCGIIGMRKPLLEVNKKQRLVHSSSSQPSLGISRSNTLSQHYDGMGGRSKLDDFPRPNPNSEFKISKPKQPSVAKKANSLSAKNMSSQKKTIDRFFGGLDSP